MKNTNLSLAIVIPIYNEEQRLSTTFDGLDRFLSQNPFSSSEIIFVDDGSSDRSKEIILSRSFSIPHKLIETRGHLGKGAAVRAGMLFSKSNYAITVDADMSTSLSEIIKFIPYIEEGCPVIIGSRKMNGSEYLLSQPRLRRMLGGGYIIFANAITGISVSDITCGFKCFSREAIEKIFSRTKINEWSYDAEVLFLARQFGFRIGEVPVSWRNDPRSHVYIFSDTLRSFIDIFRIRFSRYK